MCAATAIEPMHMMKGLWVRGDEDNVKSSTQAAEALMA